MRTEISTALVEPKGRWNYWRQALRESGVLIEMECDTDNFVGSMRKKTFGALTLFEMNTETPHRAFRHRPQGDVCFFHMQTGVHDAHFRGAREYDLKRGTMRAYDTRQAYELDFDNASHGIVLAMPRSRLDSQIDDLDQHLNDELAYDEGLVTTLVNLCSGLLAGERDYPAIVEEDVSASLIDLLMAIFREGGDASLLATTSSRVAARRRAKAYIEEHLRNPELGPHEVARSLGLTVGYLHKLFREERSSIMRLILAKRLEGCRQDLARGDRTLNINQVAFAWGFSDASHFTRSFKARFGVAPRDYRRAIQTRRSA